MRPFSICFRWVLLLGCALGTCSRAVAQGRTPVMEFASLLTSVDVGAQGLLVLEEDNDALTAVFLPQGAPVEAVLTKAGSNTALHVQDFYVNHVTPVFARLSARGKYKPFHFTEPGEYRLVFRSGNHVMTELPFTVFTRQSGDTFDPQTAWYLSGPWDDWAHGFSQLQDGAEGQLHLRMWARRESFDGPRVTDKYRAELVRDGDVLAVSNQEYVGTQKWRSLNFAMTFPESKGGRKFAVKNLAQDGKYHFVVRKDDQLHGVYELTMQGGKPVMHSRQAATYRPRTQYIVPRYPSLTQHRGGAGDMVWMKKLAPSAGLAIAAGQAAPVADMDEARRRAWRWLPTSVDPNRSLNIVVTDVETRSDTHIAAGEDIVVFGTGFPTGVKYLRAGESQATEIPDGEVYSSTLFHVAGKKIVLVRKNQVVIYDTETNTTHEIPASEITLYNPIGGLHRGNLLNADGYLVAAINRATAVADGNIVKVIDVSGPEPQIIPIKNADYTDRQVSSVDVDAKAGMVAVSSREKKLVTMAKVAPLAQQNVIDLTDYRGVDRRQIYLEDDVLVYADEDLKVRMLRPGEPPRAVTDQPVGSSSNGFTVRQGRLVIATQEHFGTRYHMAMSDLPDRPLTVPGTATPIPDTSGGLGMAGMAAITLDKTVFIAGTPSGGIGVGEHLQMLDEDRGAWIPLKNSSGQVISAIDVTCSIGFMAFKSADRDRKTTIGYATHGQRIQVPGQSANGGMSSGDSNAGNGTPADSGPTMPLELADDNPYNTGDERQLASLGTYLETEKSVGEAYVAAWGDEGKRKTVELIVKNMTENGDTALIAEFLAQSKLADDAMKRKLLPDAAQQEQAGKVDVQAVQAALQGAWKSVRFNAIGKDLPDAAIENLTLTFANGKYVMNMGSEIQTGTYQLHADTHPMTMDIHIGDGKNQGEQRLGSFKLLKGGYLLVVFGTNEQQRPTRFVPDGTGGSILAAYSKVK